MLHGKANQLGGVSVGWAKHGGILKALGPYHAMEVKENRQVSLSLGFNQAYSHIPMVVVVLHLRWEYAKTLAGWQLPIVAAHETTTP